MEQLRLELKLSKKSSFSKSAKGGRERGWWGHTDKCSHSDAKTHVNDNLFTLAIFWKKKWEGGEAGSTVHSHVLSQQMEAAGPRALSPWHHITA